MAYSPTAAVAHASGRTSGERAMNATNVSSCSTVTALPPARAGSGVGRRHSHAPTYPSAATMSRARTPTISRGCSRPVRATVKNAAAMKTLSAVGSRTAPARDSPNRRASIPSKKSDAAAAPTSASCHSGWCTNGNAAARGSRSAVRRSARVTHGFTCPSLRCAIPSSREPQFAETGGDLPRPRRRRAGPRVRGVPGAEVRRRPAGLQGRRDRQPALHYFRGRGPHLPHDPRVRRGSTRRSQTGRLLRRDGDLRPLRALDRRDRQHLVYALHDRALRLRAAPRFQPRHRLQGAVVRGAVVVGPPARDQRQPQVVPRDVDVLGNPGAISDGRCSIKGPTTLVARDRLPLHLGAMQRSLFVLWLAA